MWLRPGCRVRLQVQLSRTANQQVSVANSELAPVSRTNGSYAENAHPPHHQARAGDEGGAQGPRAAAHQLALLSNPEARFADLGPDWHERKTDRDHKIRTERRQLRALGLNVTITRVAAICNKLRLWPQAELVMIVTA
jgi:hypothetical protein